MRALFVLFLLGFLANQADSAAGPQPGWPEVTDLLQQAKQAEPAWRRAVPLMRLQSLSGYFTAGQRSRFDQLLAQIRRDHRLPLALRRLAAEFAARRQLARGHIERARLIWTRLGRQRDWWLAESPGAGGRLSWRRLPPAADDGLLALARLLPARPRSPIWLATTVRFASSGTVLLWSGCEPGCTIWHDGKLLLHQQGVHSHSFDQQALPTRVPAGRSSFLVRLQRQNDNPRFSLAITDLAGRATGQTTGQPPEVTTLPEPPPAITRPAPGAPPTLPQWFASQANRHPGQPLALAEAAYVLSQTGSYDSRQELVAHLVAESVARLAQASPEHGDLLLLLAQASDDQDTKLQLLEMIPETSQAYGEARWLLGQQHLQLNQPWSCWQAMQQARSGPREFWPARLGQVECLQLAGLEGLALRQAEQLLQEHADVPEVVEVTASLARNLGERKKARSLYLRLRQLQADSLAALSGLYELDRAAGDLDRARRWLEARSRLEAGSLEPLLQQAELLLSADRLEEASLLAARIEHLAPWDQRPAELRARLAIIQGKRREAVAALRQALERRPNDKTAALRLQLLHNGQPWERFYQPWLADPHQVGQAATSPPEGPVASGAERLLDTRVVRIHPGGAVSRFRQQLLRVLDHRGAKRLRTFHISYAPGRQRLEVLRARVIRASGMVDQQVLSDDISMSEPWYNVYYDVHARQLTFPKLSPGDIIEVTTLRTDTGAGGLLDGYFGDLVRVDQPEPTRRWRYVLQAPQALRLYFNRPQGQLPRRRQLPGGRQELHWQFENLAACEQEPAMPGAFEVGSYLHISTHADWPELAHWYHRHAQDQLVPSRRVVKLARRLTDGLRSIRQKINTLYRFVSDDIRYVALEFGVHSYLPAPAAQVLAQRFGDCKDKSALLVSLLRAAGIPARLVLLRAGSGDYLPARPASLIPFNHAIVQVPALDLWLDPTVSHYPAGLLPPPMQGVAALPIAAGDVRLTTSPVSRPAENLTIMQEQVQLAPDGGGLITVTLELRGYLAPLLRTQLASGRSAEQVLREQLGQIFPNGRLRQVQLLSGQDAPESPLRVRLQIVVAGLAQALANNHYQVLLLGRLTSYRQLFAPFAERTHDLLLGVPWQVVWRVCHHWPEGWRLEKPAPEGRLDSPWFTARVETTTRGRESCTEAELTVFGGRVPAAKYAEFRSWLEKLDNLLNGRLVLRATSAGGGA